MVYGTVIHTGDLGSSRYAFSHIHVHMVSHLWTNLASNLSLRFFNASSPKCGQSHPALCLLKKNHQTLYQFESPEIQLCLVSSPGIN